MVAITSGQTGPAREFMEAGLPGTRFYAPQARIVDESGSPIVIGKNPVNSDLVSVRVTQTHHGVSQVAITMNNQRHDEKHKPLLPTWKYNGMDPIKFGLRVRVEFRYGNTQIWTPMIVARITDVSFSFPSGGGAQLTLQGEDLLSLLKNKPEKDERYRNKSEFEIVTSSLSSSGSKLTLFPAERDVFQETLKTVTHRKSQTYLQFIESLAERMDYEVFVEPENPNQVYFQPARSTYKDIDIVDLTWHKDLVEFRPKFKVWDIYTDVTAKGRHPRRRKRIKGEATAKDLEADLHTAPNGKKPMDAIKARDSFFSDENRPEANSHSVKVTNLDENRAKLKAVAVLRKRAREFLTAEASIIGFTKIRPGIHVNINGMSAPFDGIYYVTKVVHALDSGGYKTQCSLRRPGMLDPKLYPGAGKK